MGCPSSRISRRNSGGRVSQSRSSGSAIAENQQGQSASPIGRLLHVPSRRGGSFAARDRSLAAPPVMPACHCIVHSEERQSVFRIDHPGAKPFMLHEHDRLHAGLEIPIGRTLCDDLAAACTELPLPWLTEARQG